MTTGPDLATIYAAAAPFPHIVIEHAIDHGRAARAARDVAALDIPAEPNFYGSNRKRRLSDLAAMPESVRDVIAGFHDNAFIGWLEKLTGIRGLIPDPALAGGGVHRIEPGGFLKVHADFNWNERLQLYRRVNLLLYLNDGWLEDWGGHLELWLEDMSACAARIAPQFNRMVVFSTTDRSFHGHPEPLRCPPGVTRDSIALYYYTTEPAPETRFPGSIRTNYRPRPGEALGLRHKVHQVLIRCHATVHPFGPS